MGSGGSGGGGASSAASSLTSSTKEEDDATSSLRVRRAVCTADVFEALANYLRSPGAPYKRRVVYLITQLLKSPQLFPFDCEPNINLMNGVKVQVMKRCLSIFKKESLVVLPEGLQQLVEMVLISREAKEYFQKRRKDHEEKNKNNEKVEIKIEKVDKIEKGKKIDKVETIVEQDKEKVADVVEGSGEWECAGCAAMNS